MFNDSSSPTLTNCAFTGNSADYGGGMFNYASDPPLTDCTFTDNSASAWGGGMCNASSSPTLTDCTFTGNSADYYGGGMYNDRSNPTLTDCTFTGNSASSGGGGMRNFNSENNPILTGCAFCENIGGNIYGDWVDDGGNCLSIGCDDSDGDGIPDCGNQDSDLELSVPSEYDSILAAIDAAAPGGVITIDAGIYSPFQTVNTRGKPITIRGTVDANGDPATIIDGGGQIRVLECTAGESVDTVFENLVIQNGFSTNGGGMYNSSNSRPTLTNCNFCGNTSTSGDRNIGGTAIDDKSSGNRLLLNCNTGDVNFDLQIDSGDLGYLLALWGASSVLNADINQDGEVNGADLAYILSYFGGTTDDTTAP
jgi:hypothetical protein